MCRLLDSLSLLILSLADNHHICYQYLILLIEFKSVIAFRQHHQIPRSFNQSDLYFLCRMKPITYNITPCPDEVIKCEWIKLDALSQADDVTPLVHKIVKLLRFGKLNGFKSIDNYCNEISSVYPGLKYKLFHRPE